MAELFAGAGKSNNPESALAKQRSFLSAFTMLVFDERAAEAYGHIRSYLELNGTPIGPYDLQIAAISAANNLTLVTHNTGEFSRVPGLSIEDWET
jgi:tRNA(fMet)-specific endonuclease VapC